MCKTCYGATDFDCSECIDGYYLNVKICTLCNEACTLCTGGGWNQCSECSPGYYFKPASMCMKCPNMCIECTNQYNCTSCKYNR